jgi:hypothetical protein
MKWWRTRRTARARSTSSAMVDRRTVLAGAAGAAGAAGIAAGVGSSLGHATAAAALPAMFAASPTPVVAADQVSVVPAGELTSTDAQAALEELDGRLNPVHLIDDLQVAVTRVDDFIGGTAASGSIGELGWSIGGTGGARTTIDGSEPGVFVVDTGGKVGGAKALFFGGGSLVDHPVLMCEWRLRMNALNDANNRHALWFGLHDDQTGAAEPTTGFYFRYDGTDGKWKAVCANAGARTVVVGSKVADTAYHRFRITCDGSTTSPIARFYVDDLLIATITASVPSGTHRYAPAASIRKVFPANLAGATRSLYADYFAMRWEHAR